MKTVVIGSGMAGLTAGAYLQQAGYQVTIFEQFDQPGGVTATVRQDGFGWDLGPLILEGFGPGDRGTLILEELGVSERVRTRREERGLVLPEFAMWKPAEYGGPYWRKQRLADIYPDERENLERYYDFYDRVLDLLSLLRRCEDARGIASLLYKLRLWLGFQPLKQYAALLGVDGCQVTFAPDAIAELAAIAAELNRRLENIGARRLQTVMAQLLDGLLFAVPDEPQPEVLIDALFVRERLAGFLHDEDLSRYIL